MIITCPTCGAKNRIHDIQDGVRIYRCGKCRTRLDYDENTYDNKDASVSSSHRAGLTRARRVKKVKRITLRFIPFLYPLLFSMAPILVFYAANVAEMDPSEIIMPLLSALALAIIPLLLLRYLLKDIMKAALITSIFLLLFFYYGFTLSIFKSWSAPGVPDPPTWIIIFIVFCILLIIGTFITVRTHRDLSAITVVLTIIAALMFLGPTLLLIGNETSIARVNTNALELVENNSIDASQAVYLPDIYYIILDRYASASTLEDYYDFDNSEFLDSLAEKGFYIASESKANYLNSESSLGSSLNMEYINYLSEELGEEYMDLSPIFSMMRDYAVWRILESIGYEFIHFGTWWGPTMANPFADVNYNYNKMPYSAMFLLENTLAYPVCIASKIIDDRHERHYESALYTLDNLIQIPAIDKPTFVFAHMLFPHPPYVFDTDGSYLSTEKTTQVDENILYINQLIYANSRIQLLIEELLSRSSNPPIIILQADEGPYPEGTELRDYDWAQATESSIKQKMGILNAYYLPDIDYAVLYPSITPVNSFRVIFNSYFNADFELLPDMSYVLRKGDPYKFVDVTDILD